METKNYEDLITSISQQIAEKFLVEEKDICKRALLLDADISDITRQIGLETTKRIYEKMICQQIDKKNSMD